MYKQLLKSKKEPKKQKKIKFTGGGLEVEQPLDGRVYSSEVTIHFLHHRQIPTHNCPTNTYIYSVHNSMNTKVHLQKHNMKKTDHWI